jgi:diadenosine tetraphosphate (Ap4A) HIT family hydrolase
MQDCVFCGSGEGRPTKEALFADEHFSLARYGVNDAPGWFLFWSNRHVESVAALNTSEQEALGRWLATVSGTVAKVLPGVERVYFVAMGEKYPHFHVLLAARGQDVPSERRGPTYLTLGPESGDAAEADEVAARVAALLAQTLKS